MAQLLKLSTAVDVLIGPFVDITDAATAETGESPSVKLSKNGQTLAAKNDVTTPVHDADGYHNCELDATDTGTLGTLILTVAASATALPVRHEYMVITANAWDSIVGGTDTLEADLTQIGGVAQSATDLKDFADAGYDPATNKVQGVVLVDTTTTNTDIGAAGAGLTEAGGTGDHLTAINLPNQTMDITGNLSGSVGSVTGAVGSVTGAVGSVTGAVGSVAGNVDGNVTGSVGSLAAQAKADVNAEVDTALVTTTYAEPGQGAPAATASLKDKIGYLYKAWRNLTEQTSTTLSLYDDAGTTVDQKATHSDDLTTYTKGEVGTGP